MSTKKYPVTCVDCCEVRLVGRPGRNSRCRRCAATLSGASQCVKLKRSESQRLAMARPLTKEIHSQKARENALRQSNSDEFRIKISLSQGGDGDLSRMNRRCDREDKLWRKQVKERDNHMCQICGTNEDLHAHHIKPKSSFPELRHTLSNGITLCQTCHLEEHIVMKNNNGITRAGLVTLLGA
jgi:5-methylcytosine-specific restriction endonuclease McrA